MPVKGVSLVVGLAISCFVSGRLPELKSNVDQCMEDI